MSLVPSDWLKYDTDIAIALGYIGSTFNQQKFGYNSDIGIVQEDIWTEGGTYVFPSNSGQAMVVKSSNVADTTQLVFVQGLDENFLRKSAVVTLTGTANVALDGLWSRVYRIRNVGSTAWIGKVTVEDTGNTTVFAAATANDQQSHMMIYTTAADETSVLTGLNLYLNKAGGTATACIFELRIRLFGGVFGVQSRTGLQTTGTTSFDLAPISSGSIPPKTDLILSAVASAQTVDVSAALTFRVVATEALPD